MSDKCIDKCESPYFEGTFEGSFNHPDKDGKSKPENEVEYQCEDTERWREDHHSGKNAYTTLGKRRKPHPGNPVISYRDQDQQAKTKDKSQRDCIKQRDECNRRCQCDIGNNYAKYRTGPVSYTHLTLPTNREV